MIVVTLPVLQRRLHALTVETCALFCVLGLPHPISPVDYSQICSLIYPIHLVSLSFLVNLLCTLATRPFLRTRDNAPPLLLLPADSA